MRMTLTCSLLAQQVNEPAADCISSSSIDLSEHVNAHADRISPAVTRRSQTSTQTVGKLSEKWDPLLALLPATLRGWQDKSGWINSGNSQMIISKTHAGFWPCVCLEMWVVYNSDHSLFYLALLGKFWRSALLLHVIWNNRLIVNSDRR